MYETGDSVVVKTSVAGMKPDDVDITIAGNVLSISGETKAEEEVKEENYIRRERRYGAFHAQLLCRKACKRTRQRFPSTTAY